MLDVIKVYFDVNTYALAHYVGLSKAQIDSVLAGRRALSLDHLLAFNELKKALEEETSFSDLSGIKHYVSKEPKGLQLLITKITEKYVRLQERLKKVSQNRANALRGLHACHRLLKEGKLTLQQSQWVQLRESHLGLKLNENPISLVLRLESEIAGLEAQLNFLESKA